MSEDNLILSEEFAILRDPANEVCRWINGKTPEDSKADRIVSISIVPFNEPPYRWLAFIFYRERKP